MKQLIPFLYKPTQPTLSSSTWSWPNCGNPKTLSFRAETTTINSFYVAAECSSINNSEGTIELEEDEHSSLQSFDQSIENVIRGVRSSSSERLFFDNHIGEATSCILGDPHQLVKKTNNRDDCVTSNSSYISNSGDNNKVVVLMEMDSRDPFEDFKKSMEEMVEASGFNMKDDWDSLDQLLNWYLKINCKTNRGYILGAFIDLLVSFQLSSASNSSFSSPTTSSSSGTSCENDHNSSSHSSSSTVITESPSSDLSLSSNCSTGPSLLTLIKEEEDDENAGLDHRLTHHQEENNISHTK